MVVALLPLCLFSSILLSQLRVLIKAIVVMIVTCNCAVLISQSGHSTFVHVCSCSVQCFLRKLYKGASNN